MAPRGVAEWWRGGVVYQIYPRSFADADGDGTGDLPGITEKLDYLSWLGVNAIWICPFYRSPMRDFGYDVSDFRDVDPTFGNLGDFDALVDAAHERGMRVVVDFVPNHTSDEHPWFAESRSSRDNPKRGWYVWRDPKPNGAAPNNWVSYWGGSAWEWDVGTGQYYLHSFMPEMPDLDWRNPEVEEAMLGVARFWLERGVDGFRVDSAQQIMKDPFFRDNPANPDAGPSAYKYLGGYDLQLHLHDKGHEDVHEVYRRFRSLLDEYGERDGRGRLAIGEVHVFDRPGWGRHWASYYGADLDEFHVPFNLTLVGKPWHAEGFRRAIEEMEALTPEGAWPSWVLGNHDEPRIASRVGRGRARGALMLLLTLRGTPTLYYGDEIGMEDVPVPPERVRDPFEKASPGQGLGRDPERSPMQWSAGTNAGFCPEGVEPWLPVAGDHAEANVEGQAEDPRSMLSLTRRLLALRQELPALRAGGYEPLRDGVPGDCLAYVRRHREGGDCLVALNFSGEARELRLPDDSRGRILLSTLLDREGGTSQSALRLRANEGVVVGLQFSSPPAPVLRRGRKRAAQRPEPKSGAERTRKDGHEVVRALRDTRGRGGSVVTSDYSLDRRPEDEEWGHAHGPGADGVNLHYVRRGSGDPVVLLHGWPGFWYDWRRVVFPLAEGADVVAPDFRGFGGSDKPEGDPKVVYAPDRLADDVVCLLDHLGMERFVVAGHDTGAVIAQVLARRVPERVSALALFNPPHAAIGDKPKEPGAQRESWYHHFHALPWSHELIGYNRDTTELHLRHFYDHWVGNKESVRPKEFQAIVDTFARPGALGASFGWYRATYEGESSPSNSEPEEPISLPTVVRWGELDPVKPASWAEGIEETFPNLDFRFVGGAGHFVPFEAPEETAAAILTAMSLAR